MNHRVHAFQERRRDGRRAAVIVGAVIAALLLAACGGNGDGAGDEGEVGIRLQEWAVVPSQQAAPAGEITFRIENVGEETHEFVVIRTDLSVLDLPTAEDGSVDEHGQGIEVVDEVEDIPAGESEELTVDLEAGHYALICNIVEEENGEHESHFQMGMRADFDVE
jgi:uncharacterized cupredoxin-like copper-binding protein